MVTQDAMQDMTIHRKEFVSAIIFLFQEWTKKVVWTHKERGRLTKAIPSLAIADFGD